MGVEYTDNSAEFFALIEKAADGGLKAATQMLDQIIAKSMPNAPMADGAGGWTQSTRFHSIPGDPPFSQTNTVKGAVTHGKISKLVWAAGLRAGAVKAVVNGKRTGPDYSLWLEFGTSRMGARPFLRPAINNNKAKIAKEFNRGFALEYKRQTGGAG